MAAQDTDVVITTRELVWMCKSMGINLPALQPEKPDELLGESTGAAAIYGATGGVMESALRTAYALKFGTPPPAIEFETVRGMDRLREAVIDFGGQELRVAIGTWPGRRASRDDGDRRRQRALSICGDHGLPGRLHRRRRSTLCRRQ